MTLVEVLVAVTVGSLLMVGAAVVAEAGLPRIQAVGDRMRNVMEEVQEQQRLIRQANSDPGSFDWQGRDPAVRRLTEP
jgi:type II secretory pathway component PulJ